MGCEILNGLNFKCKDEIAGIRAVFFADYGLTFQTSGSQVIGIITTASGSSEWYKYSVIGTNGYNEDNIFESNAGMGYYEQILRLTLQEIEDETNYEIKKFLSRKVHIVINDKNGRSWLIGKRGAQLEVGESIIDKENYKYILEYKSTDYESALYIPNSSIEDPFGDIPVIIIDDPPTCLLGYITNSDWCFLADKSLDAYYGTIKEGDGVISSDNFYMVDNNLYVSACNENNVSIDDQTGYLWFNG